MSALSPGSLCDRSVVPTRETRPGHESHPTIMTQESTVHKVATAVMLVALVATVVLGLVLRLQDPLSSPAVPAEDPYTHMALTRSHLADGNIEPLYTTGTTYPPGLHSVLAATWVYTGADLYDIFRVGASVMGAIGVLGVGLLLTRWGGLAAGLTGAMAFAVAPEAIFRTTMMAPTAFDLAVLPFLFYALLQLMQGRFIWAGPAAALCLFLTVAHPWVLGILGPAILVMAVLALMFKIPRADKAEGKPEKASMAPTVAGIGAVLLVSGMTLGVAVFACWTDCGLGFQDIAVPTLDADLDRIALAISGTSVGLGVLLVAGRKKLVGVHEKVGAALGNPRVRPVMSVLIGAVVLGILIPAIRAGMPDQVDLPRMMGWPIIALAAAGLVALPYIRSPAILAGAGIAAATFPFVVHNPFHSEYWPHRTAVYLSIGMVLLAGAFAGAAIRAFIRAWNNAAVHRGHLAGTRLGVRSAMAGGVLSLFLAISLAGTVYAVSPPEYEGGWYRLYPDCEFEALRDVAQNQDESTIIITGGWEAKLVMAAFAPEPLNVWPSRGFYWDGEHRNQVLNDQLLGGKSVVVLVDRYLALENPGLDLSFLNEAPWTAEESLCNGMGIVQSRVLTYRAEGVPQ